MSSISVDINSRLGAFKPVNGIDNGPVCFGSLIDSSRYYRQAAFPFCRLHDTNYPHPREVDIPTIFKDFSLDADSPASYDFRATDAYLKSILDTGARIIYRLGVSIEHPKLKYFTSPPSDFNKWARIALNIARHYNEGWADGFRWGIKYWEVWNEPDQLTLDREKDPMWSGTPEQYYELYVTTAKLFKQELPDVLIGGPASCGMLDAQRYEYFVNFLSYVKEHNAPLDFCSWHIYASRLESIEKNALIARELLDRFGFTSAVNILDEWNYLIELDNLWGRLFSGEDVKSRLEVFSETGGTAGASFTAAAMIKMLDLPVDIATLYDGQPTNIFGTIFDRYGIPTKQFYAFDAFNKVKASGQRVECVIDIEGVYAMSSSEDGNTAILAVNWDAESKPYSLNIKGLDEKVRYKYELSMLDDWRNLEKIQEEYGTPSELPHNVFLHRHSFALISISII